MDALLPVAGLVVVGAIAPGPNNLVVMRAAARAGVRGALPALAGVVLGGLALLAVVVLAGGVLLRAAPAARTAVAVAGALYLAWLGAGLVLGTFRWPGRSTPLAAAEALPGTARSAARVPGVAALFAFQFLNPKSWVMVSTAAATAPGDGPPALLALALVFAFVPAVCLLAWSSLGARLAVLLHRGRARGWFDRATGGLLVASALLLLEG